MELPPFDAISKIWAPTRDELREFCMVNRYVREMYGNDVLTEDERKAAENSVVKIEEPEPSTSSTVSTSTSTLSNEELPIHSYLYTLIKKDIYYTPEGLRSNGVHFMDEEAITLSSMLERDGFVHENVSEDSSCMVCATERLEKELMDMMKRQLQLTKLAREYYSKSENEEKYNICSNHRVFNPKNYIPRVNGVVRQQQRPDLVAELMRVQNGQFGPLPNYFSVPNFAASPEVISAEAELKYFQMRAQANQDNSNAFEAQAAAASRDILPNYNAQATNADQPSSIPLPDKISAQASVFFPNQTQTVTSNHFPRASSAQNFWNSAQESALSHLSTTINQPSAANFLSSQANGQIAPASFLANNMTAQTSSANFITNRIAQNLVYNNFPNNVAVDSTSANNYFANSVNGENNLINLSAANNSPFINRHNNLQAQAARQALINNAINNIQDQNRGRKILGKKY